jgi:hypothetical protein
VRHYEETVEEGFSLVNRLSGIKVMIKGARKAYEVYTDRNGVYEIYGLPQGLYHVEPEIPPGSKLRFSIDHGPVEVIDRKVLSKDRSLVTTRNKLDAIGCVSVDFVFSSDTLIRGRVIGSDGSALRNVCLKLEPLALKVSPYFRIFDCTDKDGSFELTDMPPGEYRLVANYDGEITSFAPFPALYYPGTPDKEKATVITVIAGAGPQKYDIVVPSRLPTKVLKGVLRYSDGRPVVNEIVSFKADEERDGYKGDTNATTDEQGRFSLLVLDGWKGKVFGSMFLYEGRFENCPAVSKLIKKKGSDGRLDVDTNAVRVEANEALDDIKLTFPFPFCVEAQDQ